MPPGLQNLATEFTRKGVSTPRLSAFTTGRGKLRAERSVASEKCKLHELDASSGISDLRLALVAGFARRKALI